MKIGVKLTVSFIIVAIASMLLVGIISFNKAKNSLVSDIYEKLLAVREAKEDQVEDYYELIKKQVLSLADDPTVVSAMHDLDSGYRYLVPDLKIDSIKMNAVRLSLKDYVKREFLPALNSNLEKPIPIDSAWNSSPSGEILQSLYISLNAHPRGEKGELNNASDGSRYSMFHNYYHPVFRKFQQKFDYYDIFLADLRGNVIYTCEKELDYGTNMLNGPWSRTNIAAVYRDAVDSLEKDQIAFADFKRYYPSYAEPASFIATPIFDNGVKIGVLMFQMPVGELNDIMTNDGNWEEVGFDKTGECYIVGGDSIMRSQSRFLLQDSVNYFDLLPGTGTPSNDITLIKRINSSVGLQHVNTDGVADALRHHDGEKIFRGYRGTNVLCSYGPVDIHGVHWVIMSEMDEDEALSGIDSLRRQVIIASSSLVLLVILLSFFLSRRMVKPIKELSHDAMEIAKGNFGLEIKTKQKDEVGMLAVSFRKMQSSIHKLISDLKDINTNLEKKVEERTEEINKAKEVLEHKNKEILDSINYALRLQQAILPPKEKFNEVLKDSFVLFKPKDIVSGDFFWMSHTDDLILLAVVDCTGHGVPGALVSMVGSSGLDRCVGEFGLRKPSDILDKLRELVIDTFETRDNDVKDGMDITLVSIKYKDKDKARKKAIVNYSGANNPLWIRRNNKEEIEETKADKQPIGVFDFGKPFTNHVIEVEEGDCIYLFSDGYADQFGGPMGKKFRYKTLKNLLQSLNNETMQVQHDRLDERFNDWKGELQQIDDVCVMGIRI